MMVKFCIRSGTQCDLWCQFKSISATTSNFSNLIILKYFFAREIKFQQIKLFMSKKHYWNKVFHQKYRIPLTLSEPLKLSYFGFSKGKCFIYVVWKLLFIKEKLFCWHFFFVTSLKIVFSFFYQNISMFSKNSTKLP